MLYTIDLISNDLIALMLYYYAISYTGSRFVSVSALYGRKGV